MTIDNEDGTHVALYFAVGVEEGERAPFVTGALLGIVREGEDDIASELAAELVVIDESSS